MTGESLKAGATVTAKERKGQYNSITEKYVSSAVRDEHLDKRDIEVKPLQVGEGSQIDLHHLDHKEKNPTGEREGTQANLVSHTELMREMYSSSYHPALPSEQCGNAHRVDKFQSVTAPCNVREEARDKVKVSREEARDVDVMKVRKKYIITQQEIVFYIKNADGKISIVHRPLITGEKIYGSLRKRNASQPNMTDLDKLDSTDGLGFIKDVGNINLRPGDIKHQSHQHLQQQEWRSSGSIFDCNQGCFSDDTVCYNLNICIKDVFFCVLNI